MGWLDDVRIYDRVRTPQEIAVDATAAQRAAPPIKQVVPLRPDTIPYRTVFDVRDTAAGRQAPPAMLAAVLVIVVVLLVLRAKKAHRRPRTENAGARRHTRRRDYHAVE